MEAGESTLADLELAGGAMIMQNFLAASYILHGGRAIFHSETLVVWMTAIPPRYSTRQCGGMDGRTFHPRSPSNQEKKP